MRIFRGSEGTAPYICDNGVRWRLGSSTGSPSYPPTHLPTYCTGGCMMSHCWFGRDD